jgi:hypothetical protein
MSQKNVPLGNEDCVADSSQAQWTVWPEPSVVD